MIPTNIYRNESNIECVDMTEILFYILNQFYRFDKVIEVKQIKDIKKISNTNNYKQSIYVNVSNYTGSLRTVIRKLNMEAFININTTIITVIPTSLLKFVSNNCSNVEVEYIPNTLKLADTEIEVEDNLCIVTFNPKNIEGEK
ncbi:hypothetical protein [Clostridioides sp. ZZV14-6387]|uniref:hypothetical protein n=1 Tax=Clostridioides sp. ZZV14-6387 TaxID=2811497 RepID=UPI001D102C70|nr:hypothetical protein [Clostridioides sp. ZZV14-6387]